MSSWDASESVSKVQWWKGYCNIIKQLRDRGYHVPSRYEMDYKTFHPIIDTINNNSAPQLILNELTLVASKPPHTKDEDELKLTATVELIVDCAIQVSQQLKQDQKDASKQKIEYINRVDKLLDQGIDTDTGRDTLSFLQSDPIISTPRCRENEVVVLFLRSLGTAFGKDIIQRIIAYQRILKCKHLILMLHVKNEQNPLKLLSPWSRNVLDMLRYPSVRNTTGTVIEYFSVLAKSIDISTSVYHSQLEKMPDEQKELWLAANRLRLEHLETMGVDDPIVSYFDFQMGDILLVHEYDKTTNFMSVGGKK